MRLYVAFFILSLSTIVQGDDTTTRLHGLNNGLKQCTDGDDDHIIDTYHRNKESSTFTRLENNNYTDKFIEYTGNSSKLFMEMRDDDLNGYALKVVKGDDFKHKQPSHRVRGNISSSVRLSSGGELLELPENQEEKRSNKPTPMKHIKIFY